jgi:RNA polymerase sigma-70 factor, ECF subfamily
MSEASANQLKSATMTDADAALVRGLLQRSPVAYDTFSSRFAASLHRFIAAHLPEDIETVEDIVVETLVDAARNIGQFDPQRASLSAWTYGIARRHVQIEMGRRKRKKAVPFYAQVPIDSLQGASDGRDVAADSAARLDAQRQVAQVVKVLSEIELTTLVLSYVDELSEQEIGQIIKRSAHAVNSILHRARRKARRKLGGDHD